MTKVVHMTSAHPPFDSRIFIKQCCSLADAGYEVTLIAPHEKEETRQGVRINPVPREVQGRLRRMLVTAYRVFRKAWSENAKIYHFHDPELIPFAMLLCLKGAKVIYDVHEDVPKQTLAKEWISKFLRYPVAIGVSAIEWISSNWMFSGIVSATPYIAQRFPERKTVIVQNFPILQEINQTGNFLPMHERPHIAIYVGGIAIIRGITQCVEAIGNTQMESGKLVLAGNVESENYLQALKANSGWNRVSYLGWQDRKQIASNLASARVGLVTLKPIINYLDSYPIKMFEYMAAGLPVIASDFPLWRKIIGENKCGLLVDPMDTTAIAEAIDWIFSHPDEAQEMGKRGLNAVQTIYNWPSEEEKLVSFYQSLLQ